MKQRLRVVRFGSVALYVAATVVALLFHAGQDANATDVHWRFDESVHGDPNATHPEVAAGGVDLVDITGAKGRAAKFNPTAATRHSAALFIGGENLSASDSEIWIRVRMGAEDRWANGKRQWLAAMVPTIGENGFPSDESGIGLALIKTREGKLEVAIHRFENGRLNPDYRLRNTPVGLALPDASPLKLDLSSIASTDWTWVGLGWKSEGSLATVSLFVGDRREQTTIPWLDTEPRVLIIGAPPRIRNVEGVSGFEGYVDEIVIRSASSKSGDLPHVSAPPSLASSASVIASTPQAGSTPRVGSLSAAATGREEFDRAARRHFDRVLLTQQRNGWAPIITYPANFRFFSRTDMIPYSSRHYLGMTEASSVIVALHLLSAYETLDDPRYLAAARAIGDLLLFLQQPTGHWPSLALIEDDGTVKTRNPDRITFKDRTQSMPVVFLELLARATQDARYSAAAARGRDLLFGAQNPSGSWPNHLRLDTGVRVSVSGLSNAGELNDHATTDAMNLALIAYRESDDLVALASYLRAADWIAEVFIDAGAKGWARQYDAFGVPISARHHEPPSVALEDMDCVPRALADAYRITGDIRYARVLTKWVRWMEATRSDLGWHENYDPKTGRPIRMVNSVISAAPLDAQRDFEMTEAIRYVARALASPAPIASDWTSKSLAQVRSGASRSLEGFDSEAGSWLWANGPQGPAFAPAAGRVYGILAYLESSIRLAEGGQAGVFPEDLSNPFNRLIPNSIRLSPISTDVLESARAQTIAPRADVAPWATKS